MMCAKNPPNPDLNESKFIEPNLVGQQVNVNHQDRSKEKKEEKKKVKRSSPVRYRVSG
jgi:hypothetical protein